MRASVTGAPRGGDLLARLKSGDPEAIAEAYRRHANAVLRVARRLTRSAAEAEDVLQDVFLGLPEAMQSYEERGSFESWLKRVAARTALMKARSAIRRGEIALEEIPGDSPRQTQPPDAVDRVALERALDRLPDSLRVVFILREVEGFTHEEIAALLGIRRGTSEVRLFRAIRRLRKLLEDSP